MPTGLPVGPTRALPASGVRSVLVQRDSDEDAWRAIVENYGERIELDDESAERSSPPPSPTRSRGTTRPAARGCSGCSGRCRSPRAEDVEDELDEDFVPPAPPPLPKLSPDRLLAWAGLLGSPTILLICLVLDVQLAPWLGYLLVASFIGGFAYLVVKMPRGTDIDPWDDGARL